MSDNRSFFTKDTAAGINKAEAELDAALENERPDELGKKIKDNTKEQSPENELPDADGHNWKERYANLQRFVQKKLGDAKKDKEAVELQLKALEEKFENFTKRQAPAELPESEEEVEELKKTNPGAYNAIVRIARSLAEDIVEEKTKGLKTSFANVEREQLRVAKEDNYLKLKRLHPDVDLDALNADPDFDTWINSKSRRLYDALYNNTDDVEAASEVIALWKLETGFKTKGKPKKDAKKIGAEDVNLPNTPEIPLSGKGWDFVESEIELRSRKDHKWFELNMEKIDEAARKGRILLDISDERGSARKMAAEGV